MNANTEIKRYSMESVYNKYACADEVKAIESIEGDFVRYEDHAAEIARLQAALADRDAKQVDKAGQFAWMNAERIRDEDHVDEALRAFREDPTGDNATGIIQAALTVWNADLRAYAEQLERERDALSQRQSTQHVGTVVDKIKEALKGIENDDLSDKNGWWETGCGAEFGAKKLEEVIGIVTTALAAQTPVYAYDDEILQRSNTISELNKMTKFDSSMSREDIINKVMNKDKQNDKRMDCEHRKAACSG